MPAKPLRTKAIVLRRTNFGETDRIINILTPEGQKSVRARGVRKEKSKLAGGIEMFCVSDVVIHEGKSDIGTLTSAKMLVFYQNILTDLSKLELASQILKEINRASIHIDSPDFFSIAEQSFAGLNNNYSPALVETWFKLNLRKIIGEELNLVRDKDGNKLQADKKYAWDNFAEVFYLQDTGPITADHIKLLRLMTVLPLKNITQIKNLAELLPVAVAIMIDKN